MSWPEVYKINSDFSSPLNHLIWLNDYKTYGQDSYVYLDKNKLYELYKDYNLSMNDNTIFGEALDYVIAQNTEIGYAIEHVYGINDDLSEYETTSDIESNFNITTYPMLLTKIGNFGSATAKALFGFFMQNVGDFITIDGIRLMVIATKSDNTSIRVWNMDVDNEYKRNINQGWVWSSAKSVAQSTTTNAYQKLNASKYVVSNPSLLDYNSDTSTWGNWYSLTDAQKTAAFNEVKVGTNYQYFWLNSPATSASGSSMHRWIPYATSAIEAYDSNMANVASTFTLSLV